MLLVAANLCDRGLFSVGALTAFCFHVYSRIDATPFLRCENLIPPNRHASGYVGVVILWNLSADGKLSKTGNDCTTVGDKVHLWLGGVIERLFRFTKPGQFLFPFGLTDYSQKFKKSVENMRLEPFKLFSGCLRHGGSSHDFFRNICAVPEISGPGLWKWGKTMERYNKHCHLQQQRDLLDAGLLAVLRKISTTLPYVINAKLR